MLRIDYSVGNLYFLFVMLIDILIGSLVRVRVKFSIILMCNFCFVTCIID